MSRKLLRSRGGSLTVLNAELCYNLTVNATRTWCSCRIGTALTTLGHFRPRFWFSQKDLAFPFAFWSSEHPQRDDTGGILHFMSLYFHISFISSHHLKKSWWILGKSGWFFISSPCVLRFFFCCFLGSYSNIFTFWHRNLLIPNVFMWAIKKPRLAVIYRSECAACPKRAQKSEFAHFFVRRNIIGNQFSVCEEEK